MVKLKVTRTDGTVIEAEGTAEELAKLNLFWPWTFTYTYPNVAAGGGIFMGGTGGNWYQESDGTWKQK